MSHVNAGRGLTTRAAAGHGFFRPASQQPEKWPANGRPLFGRRQLYLLHQVELAQLNTARMEILSQA